MKHRSDKLCVFDTETTGVDIESARIVTAFIGVMNMKGELEEKWSWLINPGVEIPESASAVHGISTERAQAEGMDPAEGVFQINQRLNILDRKAMTTVVFNMPYDISLLDREIARHWPGVRTSIPTLPFDPLVMDKAIWPYRKGLRTLTEVAKVYNVPVLENAHDAEADCIMAGQLAIKLLQHQTLPKWGPLATQSIEEIVRRQPKAKHKQNDGLREFWRDKALSGYDKKEKRPLTPEEVAELLQRVQDMKYGWPMIPRPEADDTPAPDLAEDWAF